MSSVWMLKEHPVTAHHQLSSGEKELIAEFRLTSSARLTIEAELLAYSFGVASSIKFRNVTARDDMPARFEEFIVGRNAAQLKLGPTPKSK
jgi:hypothetical protein